MENSNLKSLTGQVESLYKTDKDFPQKFKHRLVRESSNSVKNHFELIARLYNEGLLCHGSNDSEATVGLKEMMVQLALMVACSKGAEATGSLMKALEGSGNLALISALRTWIHEEFAVKTGGDLSQPKRLGSLVQNAESGIAAQGANYPIAVKSLPNQLQPQKSKHVMSQFFEQAPPLNDLEKVATFNCSPESFTKGKFALKFSQEKMIARFSGGTVKLWNWRENQETTINFADKVKDLTALHYDEEIVVLGTAAGTIHLFDAGTLEEKWSERLGEPVHSLKFIESTLVVLTRSCIGDTLWWMELSRSVMRLLNRRPMLSILKNAINGFLEDRYCFVWSEDEDVVQMYDSKTGQYLLDLRHRICSLEAPASIKTINVVDLIGGTPFVVAGCKDGVIAIWSMNGNLGRDLKPAKSLKGHQGAIVDVTAINGHLLSVCQGGKLLLWSGHDLQNQHVVPIPRVLSENFFSVTCLVAHERWFVSTSSKDSIINVWALPDLWLRTG